MQPFPTLTAPIFQSAQQGTSYAQTTGLVVDAQPRMISELVATQNASNPAALAAQAKQLSQLGAGYLNLTHSGVLPGTIIYMSPEQALLWQADHRSDLYSLAVMLYELVTGSFYVDRARCRQLGCMAE